MLRPNRMGLGWGWGWSFGVQEGTPALGGGRVGGRRGFPGAAPSHGCSGGLRQLPSSPGPVDHAAPRSSWFPASGRVGLVLGAGGGCGVLCASHLGAGPAAATSGAQRSLGCRTGREAALSPCTAHMAPLQHQDPGPDTPWPSPGLHPGV